MIRGFCELSSTSRHNIYTHRQELLAVVLILARCRRKPSCGRVLEVRHRVVCINDDIGDNPRCDRTRDPFLSKTKRQAPHPANGWMQAGSPSRERARCSQSGAHSFAGLAGYTCRSARGRPINRWCHHRLSWARHTHPGLGRRDCVIEAGSVREMGS